MSMSTKVFEMMKDYDDFTESSKVFVDFGEYVPEINEMFYYQYEVDGLNNFIECYGIGVGSQGLFVVFSGCEDDGYASKRYYTRYVNEQEALNVFAWMLVFANRKANEAERKIQIIRDNIFRGV